MAVTASAVKGTKVVYYKEGIDPCKCMETAYRAQ
jgi:hypothetical protein